MMPDSLAWKLPRLKSMFSNKCKQFKILQLKKFDIYLPQWFDCDVCPLKLYEKHQFSLMLSR